VKRQRNLEVDRTTMPRTVEVPLVICPFKSLQKNRTNCRLVSPRHGREVSLFALNLYREAARLGRFDRSV
jgi:hypothetical protein